MLGCTPHCVKVVSLACCSNLIVKLNCTLSTLVLHSAQFHYVTHGAAVIRITSFRSRVSWYLRPRDWMSEAVSHNGVTQSVGQAVQEDFSWTAWLEDKVLQPLATAVSTAPKGASFYCEKLESRMNQYATLTDSKAGTSHLFTQIESNFRFLQCPSRRNDPVTNCVWHMSLKICLSPWPRTTPLAPSYCTFSTRETCSPILTTKAAVLSKPPKIGRLKGVNKDSRPTVAMSCTTISFTAFVTPHVAVLNFP